MHDMSASHVTNSFVHSPCQLASQALSSPRSHRTDMTPTESTPLNDESPWDPVTVRNLVRDAIGDGTHPAFLLLGKS